MAVKLRLQRFGSNKSPFYRVVASESTSPRDGKFIEIVGTYNPVANPAKVEMNKEKVLKWLENGAQPTETVRNILTKEGLWKEFTESKKK